MHRVDACAADGRRDADCCCCCCCWASGAGRASCAWRAWACSWPTDCWECASEWRHCRARRRRQHPMRRRPGWAISQANDCLPQPSATESQCQQSLASVERVGQPTTTTTTTPWTRTRWATAPMWPWPWQRWSADRAVARSQRIGRDCAARRRPAARSAERTCRSAGVCGRATRPVRARWLAPRRAVSRRRCARRRRVALATRSAPQHWQPCVLQVAVAAAVKTDARRQQACWAMAVALLLVVVVVVERRVLWVGLVRATAGWASRSRTSAETSRRQMRARTASASRVRSWTWRVRGWRATRSPPAAASRPPATRRPLRWSDRPHRGARHVPLRRHSLCSWDDD